jgi:hypothetical protein
MSFLSNLFRKAPGPDQWPIISADIGRGFQDVKKTWFCECVSAVELGLLADNTEKAKVVHTELGGAGALAITGYQICCAGDIIVKNGYIAKTLVNDFLELLRSRISGVETSDLLRCIRRYDEVGSEPSTQLFRLGVDVASYVINDQPSMMISVQVASLAEKLSALTSMVIANAFDDPVRVSKLSREITSLEMQLRPNG